MGEILGVFAAVLSSALGGTSIGATRYLVGSIDPLAIGAFRFGIGFVLLLPLALLRGDRWPERGGWAAGLVSTGFPLTGDPDTTAPVSAITTSSDTAPVILSCLARSG